MQRVFDVYVWLLLGEPDSPGLEQKASFEQRFPTALRDAWKKAAPVVVDAEDDATAFQMIADFVNDRIMSDCGDALREDVSNVESVEAVQPVTWVPPPPTSPTGRHEIRPSRVVKVHRTNSSNFVDWQWNSGGTACKMHIAGYFVERQPW